MEGITSIAFDLLSFSAITVLVVMGLGIIASMMGIFNFAHGEFLLLGAYTVYLTHALGYPVWLGMLLAPLAVALVGLLLERGVIRFFYTDPVVAMLGTYAIGLVIRESVRGLVGGLYHSVPEPVAGSFSLTLDGQAVPGGAIDLANDGQRHEVGVTTATRQEEQSVRAAG